MFKVLQKKKEGKTIPAACQSLSQKVEMLLICPEREVLDFRSTQVRETIQFTPFLEAKTIVTLFYETLRRRCIEMFAA